MLHNYTIPFIIVFLAQKGCYYVAQQLQSSRFQKQANNVAASISHTHKLVEIWSNMSKERLRTIVHSRKQGWRPSSTKYKFTIQFTKAGLHYVPTGLHYESWVTQFTKALLQTPTKKPSGQRPPTVHRHGKVPHVQNKNTNKYPHL